MAKLLQLLFTLTFLAVIDCQFPFRNNADYMDPLEYCDYGKDDKELFRRKLPVDATEDEILSACRFYYRCIPAAFGSRSISGDECPHLQNFDVDAQTCKLRRDVYNCDRWEENKLPLPRWPLHRDEISPCPDGEIQCGSKECLGKDVFCDSLFDCEDGSDENICVLGKDPNAAERCDTAICQKLNAETNETNPFYATHCHCSIDGTHIPGNLAIEDTPQMILLTFTGAITERSSQIYDDLFTSTLKNSANGCTVKATFFVSHLYTNYSAVQELHRRGHEIAAYSVTNDNNATYWTTLDEGLYDAEFEGMRLLLETFSNISYGNILGMKVPNELVGGNNQFRMMRDRNFLYDASIVVPREREPVWPYTLDFAIPHQCPNQDCPSKSFPGIWSVPLNTLDRREDALYEEPLTGCSHLDSCNINSPKYFINVLNNNLRHHVSTNRAPLVLSFTAGFFDSNANYRNVFKKWLSETASKGLYQFVTIQQALNWMVTPKKLSEINSFEGWQNDCEVTGQPLCSIPNPCELKPRIREITDESVFLNTCQRCPNEYPWLYNLDILYDLQVK